MTAELAVNQSLDDDVEGQVKSVAGDQKILIHQKFCIELRRDVNFQEDKKMKLNFGSF